MSIFQEIKSKLSILDVVNEYATVRKAGIYWKGQCPFHHERTASFTVSPHREIFYCFGCHAGGDVIAFIAQIERCSQLQAAKHLIERYNLPLSVEQIPRAALEEKVEYKERYFAACASIAHWCREQLTKNKDAQLYITERGIAIPSIDRFMLGYFPAGIAALKNLITHMQRDGFLAQELYEMHILMEGSSLYSPFEDRIILPIRDQVGRFCGFGARIFRLHDTRAKYYNSHDQEFFNKGSLLFGFDLAKKTIQKLDAVLLVEGYLDCIAMVQAGFENTIATLGTSCTVEHLKIIGRFANNLTVVYDSDAAGQQAIMRLAALCWQTDLNITIITLPAQEDPASFLQKGGDFALLASKQLDIFDFYRQRLGAGFNEQNTQEKISIIREFIEALVPITDPLKREMAMQKAAATFNVSFALLAAQLKTQRFAAQKRTQIAVEPDKIIVPVFSQLEKMLFCAILNNHDTNQEDSKFLQASLSSQLQHFLHLFDRYKAEHGTQAFSLFFDALTAPEKSFISGLLVEVEQMAPVSFDELIDQYLKKQWKMMINNVKIKLASHHDQNEVAQLFTAMEHLKQRMSRRGLI